MRGSIVNDILPTTYSSMQTTDRTTNLMSQEVVHFVVLNKAYL